MILTEADLHAYNRGELSPEATRQLESDPLAMQDAARLRAIAGALRAEATIPVAGRAETLDRLRARSARGIGVPRWVWATGVAAVAALVVVSIPPDAPPAVRVVQAVYHSSESGGVAASEPRLEVPNSAASASSPALSRAQADVPEATELTLTVPNADAASASAEAEATRIGAVVKRTRTSRGRAGLRIESDRLPELEARLRRLEGRSAEPAGGQAKPDRSAGGAPRPPAPSAPLDEDRARESQPASRTETLSVTFVEPVPEIASPPPMERATPLLSSMGARLAIGSLALALLVYLLLRRR